MKHFRKLLLARTLIVIKFWIKTIHWQQICKKKPYFFFDKCLFLSLRIFDRSVTSLYFCLSTASSSFFICSLKIFCEILCWSGVLIKDWKCLFICSTKWGGKTTFSFLFELEDSCSEVFPDSLFVNESSASAIINKWWSIGNI